jgi:hypothetical protein
VRECSARYCTSRALAAQVVVKKHCCHNSYAYACAMVCVRVCMYTCAICSHQFAERRKGRADEVVDHRMQRQQAEHNQAPLLLLRHLCCCKAARSVAILPTSHYSIARLLNHGAGAAISVL